MSREDALLSIALDLTKSLASGDRLNRLLEAVRQAVPCDATAVLELQGDELVPVATYGLAPELLGVRFARRDHPRLDAVVAQAAVVRFPADCDLPDPYDGLLLANPDATRDVHACLGCPLMDRGEVIGVLTVDALDTGAFDQLDDRFLTMLGALAGAALNTARLIEAIEASSRHHRDLAHVLQNEVTSREETGQMIGTGASIQRIREEVDMVGPSDFSVLITGETGVGKELVAREIHRQSPRREQPMIYVNCAAFSESIVESELFGHLRGAFTGANVDRAGRFEVANHGTIFLDEVGELPLSVQPKLLRALQEGEIQRVGSDKTTWVDVRVVAATNRDLEREVKAGRFRADLFHRLNMYPIHVPPLRERRTDIPLLAGLFLDKYRRRLGLGNLRLTEAARDALLMNPWPGNVRELDNVLGRAALRAGVLHDRGTATLLDVEHLQLDIHHREPSSLMPQGKHFSSNVMNADRLNLKVDGKTLNEVLEETKRLMVQRAVKESGGNWAAAARSLGMARSNLHHMAARLGLRQ